MLIEIHPLTAERMDDFYRFHSREPVDECDLTGWCFCVAWWWDEGGPDGWSGWGQRTCQQNRGLREEVGPGDGYLLYRDGEPRGWCQVGPRDRLAKLCRLYRPEPRADTWAVTCFMLHPEVRGQGFARRLLGGALDALRGLGVARVEAFPKRGPTDSNELWTGPERLFLGAGFQVVRADPTRPVLALEL